MIQLQIITTSEEMQLAFNQAVEKAMQDYIQKSKDEAKKELIISGDAVCTKLAITMPTLISWRQKGKVPFIQIGSAIRYDWYKVIEALEVSNKKKGAAA